MWTSDFLILKPFEEAPEGSFFVDTTWFGEFYDFLIPELKDTVMIAGNKVYPSGVIEEALDMKNYHGDYDIVVAKAWRTDEPFLKKKPSGFSWDDKWYEIADWKHVTVTLTPFFPEIEAPPGYYLAD